jgi:flagellar hook-associated protein 2
MAEQGKIVGTSPAGLTITQGVNDQLAMTVDGVSSTVTLTAGTYATADALAAHVQSMINGMSAFTAAGVAVGVAADIAGAITITSNRYGSASTVAVSGTGATNLLGVGPASTAGKDVAGSIGGVVASGSGKLLTGATGSDSEGLKLEITGGTATTRGTVNFSQGYAFQVNKLLDNYIGSSGFISARTTGINSSINDVKRQQEALDVRLTLIEKRYRAQFTALDKAISSMSNTSSFLTQQLASLSKLSE